jgi:hypothetical protein
MRIRKKFLQLTSYTYPHGTEGFLKSYLPEGTIPDGFGNYYIVVGEKPTSMFTCHLDTACREQKKVKHFFPDDRFIATDGTSILGADDKAGMVVILYMIQKKIPGVYFFFTGEEVGCVGSRKLAENWLKFPLHSQINKVVSFDRRGTGSIITHQLYGRCCSDEFANSLARALNRTSDSLKLAPDDTGIVTDSAQFVDLVGECTNISVGYYKEHTHYECQDIHFLTTLCNAVVKIDWNSIEIKRFAGEDGVETGNLEFSAEYYSYFKTKEGTKKMFISKSHILSEISHIWEWVQERSTYFSIKNVIWNGHKLYLEDTFGNLFDIGTRDQIMDFIPKLGSVPTSKLRSSLGTTKICLA